MKSQLFLCRSLSIDIGNQVNRTIGFYRFLVYRLIMTGLIVNALVNQLVKVDEICSGCVSKKSFYLIGVMLSRYSGTTKWL